MKKIIALALALASTAAVASYSPLMYEEFVDGRIKLCVYVDGRSLVVPASARCPMGLP